MPYYQPDIGQWSDTYCVSLNPTESYSLPGILEPNMRFEREFTFSVGAVDTTAAVLVSLHGKPETYFFRVNLADPPFTVQGMVLAVQLGAAGRITCNAGQFVVSWRERFTLIRASSFVNPRRTAPLPRPSERYGAQ
jgi:hypothetical protein